MRPISAIQYVFFEAGKGDLQQQLITHILDTVGAITCYKHTVILARMAKTRSGKTLRKTLAHVVNGKEYRVPSTIDDPDVVPEIIEVLRNKKVVM